MGSETEICASCALLPPPGLQQQRKTLVLDLDHTLIDCIREHEWSGIPPDFIYTDSAGVRGKVFCRPFLMAFLKEVRQHFELVLFTAAGSRHADAVLAVLDPSRTIFEHRLYAEHTVASAEWTHVKDLSRLGRDLSQTLLVDDCPLAGNFQPSNLLNIVPWHHWTYGDDTLKQLADFLLEEVVPASDVRQALAAQRLQQEADSEADSCEPEFVPLPSQSQKCTRSLASTSLTGLPFEISVDTGASVQASAMQLESPASLLSAQSSIASQSSARRLTVDDPQLPFERSSNRPFCPCGGLSALIHSPRGLIPSPSVLSDLFGLSNETEAQEEEKVLRRSDTAKWMQSLYQLSPGKIPGVVLSPFVREDPASDPSEPPLASRPLGRSPADFAASFRISMKDPSGDPSGPPQASRTSKRSSADFAAGCLAPAQLSCFSGSGTWVRGSRGSVPSSCWDHGARDNEDPEDSAFLDSFFGQMDMGSGKVKKEFTTITHVAERSGQASEPGYASCLSHRSTWDSSLRPPMRNSFDTAIRSDDAGPDKIGKPIRSVGSLM